MFLQLTCISVMDRFHFLDNNSGVVNSDSVACAREHIAFMIRALFLLFLNCLPEVP